MTNDERTVYIEPTQEAGRAFFASSIPGPVVMLNLLRFRKVADYSSVPHLAPAQPISGAEAYVKYVQHTLPFLTASGGELLFLGQGGDYLIGPGAEKWDAVMLIKQKSASAFLAFATNPECKAGIGHRTAALEDSRLLPLRERSDVEELAKT